MKLKILKYLSLIIAGVLIMGMIAGCGVYTKEDLAEYTKRRLKEEYGEEFEIKSVWADGKTTIAYPVSDPELLFETYYVMSNGKGGNGYVHAILGKQFKNLIEEKLEDFEYEYYVDIGLNANLSKLGTDITIEQFDEVTKGTLHNRPSYYLYLSCDALNKTDEELYELFSSILYIHDSLLIVCFITNDDFTVILENYSSRTDLSSDLFYYLDYTRKYERFGIVSENGMLNKDFDEFKEIMKEVRSNELY